VYHRRVSPKAHRFDQRLFMFYLDLDEIGALASSNKFFSHGRFNLYNFKDSDHYEGPGASAKANAVHFAKKNGVKDGSIARVMLLTHLRTLGHFFNPVSFYFCFDAAGEPVCALGEVTNTFGEMKMYFLGFGDFSNGRFEAARPKYFYISPFIDLDATLDFRLGVPGEKLMIAVDDFKGREKFFFSGIKGERKALTEGNLVRFSLKYPLVTIGVIAMIHWHAMRLYLKKVPHREKHERPDLQREVTRARIV
jgi:DUF1365 family protein